MKTCTCCRQTKPKDDFFNLKTRKDGKYVYCKTCSKQKKKDYEIRNFDKLYQRKINNREITNKKAREYRANNAQKFCDKQSSLKGKYFHLKAICKKRNKALNLTLENYKFLIEGKSCHYCKSSLPKYGVGLDRIDNSKGYIVGNVLACCTQCNRIRGDNLTVEEMELVAVYIKKLRSVNK